MSLLNKWKIYILSVKEDDDRRKHVEEVALKTKKLGFNVEIIDAIYWKTKNVMEKMNKLNIGFTYDGSVTQSQLGCFLSHRLAWERINENNDPTELNIIIEDDVDLLDFNLFLELEKQINSLESYDAIIMWKHPDKIPDNFEYIRENLVGFYFQWGLCAYSINRSLCDKMLSINYIDQPIDNYLYTKIFHHYKVYLTLKDPFVNHGFLAGNSVHQHRFKSIIYG